MSEDLNERFQSAWDTSKQQPGKWEQKRRLAAAMRLVIERLTTSDAPEAELRVAAERLEAYADALEAHPRLKFVHGFAESANASPLVRLMWIPMLWAEVSESRSATMARPVGARSRFVAASTLTIKTPRHK